MGARPWRRTPPAALSSSATPAKRSTESSRVIRSPSSRKPSDSMASSMPATPMTDAILGLVRRTLRRLASVAPSNRMRSVLQAVRKASAPSYWLSANAASADEKGDGTDIHQGRGAGRASACFRDRPVYVRGPSSLPVGCTRPDCRARAP
eukprot:2875681-Prymnesium_polylepis.2